MLAGLVRGSSRAKRTSVIEQQEAWSIIDNFEIYIVKERYKIRRYFVHQFFTL